MSDDAPVDAPKALTVLPVPAEVAPADPEYSAGGWDFVCEWCKGIHRLPQPVKADAVHAMRCTGAGVYAGGWVCCAACCARISGKR